jgi:hypothetical protein
MDLINPVSGKLFIYVSTFFQCCCLKVIDHESFSDKVIPVPPHRCPVKHEFLGMEPVPAEEPWVFSKNYCSLPGQRRTLLKELVGINHCNSRTGRGSCWFFCGYFFSSFLLWGFLLHSRCFPALPYIPATLCNIHRQVCKLERIWRKEGLIHETWLLEQYHPRPEQVPGFGKGGMAVFIPINQPYAILFFLGE